jgi:hypothetical protein
MPTTTYNFDHWEVNGAVAGTNPTLIVNVQQNLTITAIYVIPKWKVIVNSSPIAVTFIQPASPTPFTLDMADNSNVTLQAPATIEI